MNGLAGYYVSTIGKPHEYFDLTKISTASKTSSQDVALNGCLLVGTRFSFLRITSLTERFRRTET